MSLLGTVASAALKDWTCNWFIPVTYFVMSAWYRKRAGWRRFGQLRRQITSAFRLGPVRAGSDKNRYFDIG